MQKIFIAKDNLKLRSHGKLPSKTKIVLLVLLASYITLHAVRKFGTITDDTLVQEKTDMEKGIHKDVKMRKVTPRGVFAMFRKPEPEGIELREITPGEYASEGTYISEILEAGFPFNALGVHWVEELPEGTNIRIEVRISKDKVNWADWQEIEPFAGPEESSRKVYKTGHRKPDIYGALIAYDEIIGKYIQYKVVLSTTDPKKTPVLKKISFNYMDTTQGPTMEKILEDKRKKEEKE